jgi:hypothetical protein
MTGTKSKFRSKFRFQLNSVPATGRNFSGILNLAPRANIMTQRSCRFLAQTIVFRLRYHRRIFALLTTHCHPPHSAAALATSTLTPSVRAAVPSQLPNNTPAKRPKSRKTLLYESPSPNRHIPNFATRQSDDTP